MKRRARLFLVAAVSAACTVSWLWTSSLLWRRPVQQAVVVVDTVSTPVSLPKAYFEDRLFTKNIYTESDSTCQFARIEKAVPAPVRWAACPHINFTTLSNDVLRVECKGDVKVALVDHDFLFLKDRDPRGPGVQEPRRKERWDYTTYRGPVVRLNFTGREYAEVLCVSPRAKGKAEPKRNLVTRFLPRPSRLARRKHTLAKRGERVVREHLNLLVIVCDSLSRAHAMRELPQLRNLTRSLYRGESSLPYRAFMFNRLNSLGTSSPANQSPLYSGTFWVPDKRRHTESVYSRQPTQVWLWEAAQRLGFITCYGEDWANGLMGYEWHNTTGWDHRAPGLQALSLPGNKRLKDGTWLPFCRDHGELSSAMYTRYVRSFWDAYSPIKDAAIMAQLHLMEQHHDPLGSIRQVDETTTDFVRHVLSTQDNAAVVVVGDHGRTFTGEASAVDSTNPVLMAFLPKRVLARERAWATNLFVNQQRLLSHYDVHSMLSHIVHYPDHAPVGATHKLSLNLLTTEVPQNRTCAQANLKKCFCTKWERVKPTKTQAQTCVDAINADIADSTKEGTAPTSCQRLTLSDVNLVMVSDDGATKVDFVVHQGNRSRFHCDIDSSGKPNDPVSQITLWERFRPCRDFRINPNHCICDPYSIFLYRTQLYCTGPPTSARVSSAFCCSV